MTYRLTCICGQPIHASSHSGEQIAHCPACGRSIMISGPKPGVKKKKFGGGSDMTWVLIGGAGLAGVAAIGGIVWGILFLVSYANEQARTSYSGSPQQRQAPPPQQGGPSLLPPDHPQHRDMLEPPRGPGDRPPPPREGDGFISPVGELGPPHGNRHPPTGGNVPPPRRENGQGFEGNRPPPPPRGENGPPPGGPNGKRPPPPRR